MKEIKINGKNYTLEYTIGASLYDECISSVLDLIGSAAFAEDSVETDKQAVLEQLKLLGGIPKVSLTVFYAGLLEHHGTGEYAGDDSDETVEGLRDARKLVKDYMTEHKDDEDGVSWMSILNLCMECMGDDDFLAMIGVDQLTEQPQKQSKRRGRPKKTEVGEK